MNDTVGLALPGRRVIVTGAGAGLGASYAQAVAAQGAAVIVNDLDPSHAEETAEIIRSRGGVAKAFAGDVADWKFAEELVQFATIELGGLDGLVNNAGIIGTVGPMLETDPSAAEAVLRVNVLGTIYPSTHAARAMAAGGGSIVNVTSGNQSGHLGFATYGASKGAVSTLTYAWAIELIQQNIRVNAISPNAQTQMTDDLETQLGFNPEERLYPSAADNAAVVVYLLSDKSKRVNGQVVRVDYKKLSITSHPMIVSPRVDIDYTVDTIAQIFARELSERLQPCGISIASVAQL